MHVVFLSLGYHPDHTGGACRYVTEVAERLAARGHSVDVIFPNSGNRLPVHEERNGVALHRFRDESGFFFYNWRQENQAAGALLRTILAASREAPFIVNCHAFFQGAMTGLAQPYSFLFTGPWGEEYKFSRQAIIRPPWRRWFDALVAWQLHRTEARALCRSRSILTISRYYVEQLPRWHGGGLPKIEMISGGVDLERFRPAANRAVARAKFGVPPDAFLFLTVRRLDPRMGLARLIDAFDQVSPQFPAAHLWLAGSGPQREELKGRIDAHRLAGKVRLLGFVAEEDLPALYAAADCALMPSLDLEGFGLATVESLACGTPVLGSQSGATPELLEPLDPALLFAATSPEAVAGKLREVLAAPHRLPSRDQCRQYALKRFHWNGPVMALEKSLRNDPAQKNHGLK